MLKIARFIIKLLAVFILLNSIFYIQTKIYSFEEAKPFSGEFFYNPYENWNAINTIKANFHAHTKAWGGSTNGANSPTELIEAYKKKDYNVIGISNYFNINNNYDTSNYYIPLYEHGLNLLKTHKQAINPDEVLYFDFPLFQNTSQKQQIIEKLKEKNALVSVNHPKFMDGHTKEDLTRLTGYHFIEVLNHYRISDDYWDSALSAGKLVWLLGNDDVHDLNGKWNHFVMWTIVPNGKNKKEILEQMKLGKTYGVRGKDGVNWNELISCEIYNDTLKYKFKNAADSLQLIGQNGKVLKTVIKSKTIEIPTNQIETYVRCKVNTKWKSVYLNPIVRYDGKTIPYAFNDAPKVDWILTWIYRLFVALLSALLIWFVFLKKHNKTNKASL